MSACVCDVCRKPMSEYRRVRRSLTCSDDCAKEARECRICFKAIPEDRHPDADTCGRERAWWREFYRREVERELSNARVSGVTA